ncbi:hypothetical protein WK13_34450 [Burkholderia ubonensis]|uniref:ParB N-terminal domain-containing protein n=1 Tax=Burkholderia ubonensis TaxID=101571 RepID=UPI00075D5556|nr:ParB N-terminal domain-containing protein [Burkholderia ubonensis]KVR21641.1 hypothetical protein WK13_34450 [Burkholderia ubonensis]
MDQNQHIQIEYRSLSGIKPYWNNPRVNADAVAGVKKSIQEFSFLVPIVIDKDDIIVTGHTRYQASHELGLTEVPTIKATHLTEAQIKAFRLADNRVSENAKWDEAKLSEELRMLADMGFDLEATGFTKDQLDCICGEIDADCLKDLNYDAVCGSVVSAKQVVSREHIILNIGLYKFKVHVNDYKLWEASLLKEFPKRADLVNELARRLGFEVKTITAPPTPESVQSIAAIEAAKAGEAAPQ